MLERERRAEAISIGDADRIVALADELLRDLDVSVSRGPSVGLLMMRVEEPSERLPFNFAEVTVAEAEVSIGGTRGYAMVMGLEPEKALAGAILDAAIETGHRRAAEIERELGRFLEGERQRREQRWAEVAPTMVKFEEMAP
jgi:alpha-D-ribose 1-methylphosphonate 5-triphosphate synthase subunit PhnG